MVATREFVAVTKKVITGVKDVAQTVLVNAHPTE